MQADGHGGIIFELLYPRPPEQIYLAILSWAYALMDENAKSEVLHFCDLLKNPEKLQDFTLDELERLIKIIEVTRDLIEKEMKTVSDEDMQEVLFDDYMSCTDKIKALKERCVEVVDAAKHS